MLSSVSPMTSMSVLSLDLTFSSEQPLLTVEQFFHLPEYIQNSARWPLVMALTGDPGHHHLKLQLLQLSFWSFLYSIIHFQSKNQHDPFNCSFSQTSLLLSESQIICDGEKSPCGAPSLTLLNQVLLYHPPSYHNMHTLLLPLPWRPQACPSLRAFAPAVSSIWILFFHLCGICLARSVTSCIMRSPLVLN